MASAMCADKIGQPGHRLPVLGAEAAGRERRHHRVKRRGLEEQPDLVAAIGERVAGHRLRRAVERLDRIFVARAAAPTTG